MSFSISQELSQYLKLKLPKIRQSSVSAVLEMAAEGATVPFMARYRKEKTGNLDEVQIRDVLETFEAWETLVKRKEFVLAEIEKQEALTAELKLRIESCQELVELEELYRPYKRKKKTRAKIARDAGLQPLADWIWQLAHGEISDEKSLEVQAKNYLNLDGGIGTYEEALKGAHHILVEKIYNNPDLRAAVKKEFFSNAKIVSQASPKFKAQSKYEMYKEFSEPIKNLLNAKASHRYLAIRRGWQEGELKVDFEVNQEALVQEFVDFAVTEKNSQAYEFMVLCAKTSLSVHVIPSIANELHSFLKDAAETHAIQVFAENLRKVLMASPYGSKVVLGVDPGLRTGCKVALVDQSGRFVSSTVLHILSDSDKEKGKLLFQDVLKQIDIQAVAVGNGTGGREAEKFIRELFKELSKDIPVVLVNESGASVYSASDVACEEFPDLDLTVRGAISIARRLQDPLAELVKVDPKSIGVGQYQHDVNQGQLKKSLHRVVESCVNQVGVDINTASTSLLQYVAGIGPAIAKNIVERRNAKLFTSRQDFLEVPSFSSKAFEQAAGFLRVSGGDSVLDRTGIHPERYAAVRDMAQDAGVPVAQLMEKSREKLAPLKEKWSQLIGEYTFEDIISELEKPGRDPRDPYKVFKFREDIHEVSDLKKEMICPGIVTNVTNFGAFVDIGVHQDGLVHISELSNEFVSDIRQLVNPGDQVQVKVLDVESDKKQISLSMILGEKKVPEKRPKPTVAKKFSGKKASGDKNRNSKGGPKGKKPRSGGKGAQRTPNRKPPGKPFNNPFAALTDLKSD